MTDQAPELLPGEIDESGWVIELGESEPTRPAYWIGPSENPAHWPFGMWSDDNLKAVRFTRKEDAGAVVKLTVDASHNDPRATFRIAEHSWYCPPLTRPPSERPVAQVREALPLADHDEIGRKVFSQSWVIQKAIVTIAAHCTALRDHQPTGDVADLAACISHCCNELADALTSERPSEAAVAWRTPLKTGYQLTSHKDVADQWRANRAIVEPLYAIPHGDAVRAQTIEECAKIAELNFALRFTNFDKRDAVRKALADVAKAIRALSPTLASERVSERETMTSVPAEQAGSKTR